MAAGDTITKPAGSDGVPMIEGDTDEPQGPEDAAGQGVKRGDYSARGDGKQHYEYGRDSDGELQIRDQVRAMNTEPGVPDSGEKGGVDSYDAGTDEDGAYDSVAESEVQTVTVTGSPTGGDYKLGVDGEVTAAIAHNATATTVKTRLIDASDLSSGDLTVSGSAGGPYTITFAASLGNVPQLTLEDNDLTGGSSPSVTIATTNQGN